MSWLSANVGSSATSSRPPCPRASTGGRPVTGSDSLPSAPTTRSRPGRSVIEHLAAGQERHAPRVLETLGHRDDVEGHVETSAPARGSGRRRPASAPARSAAADPRPARCRPAGPAARKQPGGGDSHHGYGDPAGHAATSSHRPWRRLPGPQRREGGTPRCPALQITRRARLARPCCVVVVALAGSASEMYSPR